MRRFKHEQKLLQNDFNNNNNPTSGLYHSLSNKTKPIHHWQAVKNRTILKILFLTISIKVSKKKFLESKKEMCA